MRAIPKCHGNYVHCVMFIMCIDQRLAVTSAQLLRQLRYRGRRYYEAGPCIVR